MPFRKTRTLRAAAAAGLAALLVATGCAGNAVEERRGSIYDWQLDPTPENRQRIRDLLDDPNRDVRATAMNVLVGLGEPDAEALARAGLDDEDGFVRSIAAKLLGDLGRRDHVGALVRQLLEDPDPRARKTAAEALAVLGGDEAVGGLIEGLADPMHEVRLAAVRGVRELDPARALPALARMVLEDTEWEIRVQAAGALGAAGDPAMEPVLRRALEDESEFVRSAAAKALDQVERGEGEEQAGAEPTG